MRVLVSGSECVSLGVGMRKFYTKCRGGFRLGETEWWKGMDGVLLYVSGAIGTSYVDVIGKREIGICGKVNEKKDGGYDG